MAKKRKTDHLQEARDWLETIDGTRGQSYHEHAAQLASAYALVAIAEALRPRKKRTK